MRKKIMILTLNDYILYQPTILNLYDFLSDQADVTVVSFEPKFVTRQKDEKRNIKYLKTSLFATHLYTKIDFIISKLTSAIRKFVPNFSHKYIYYNYYLPSVLEDYLKHQKPEADIIIAVDLPALIVAQEHFGDVHFLSLEVDNNTHPNYNRIDKNKIISVFVQTELRYRYLFPNVDLKRFIVQNSPVYIERDYHQKERKNCIWAGTIDYRFGVLDCIKFFNEYKGYQLVLKGGANKKTLELIQQKYEHLIKEERIVLNQEYLHTDAFMDFVASFRIGFCFYSWELIRSSFNYQTAPSGKLFMYLAAGTPVIACNIPGFDFVKDFGAGILIDDYEPATIKKAVEQIEANYNAYSKACLEAAAYYSFDNHVQPYIRFLLNG